MTDETRPTLPSDAGVGSMVAAARRVRGLTQAEVATAVGVSQSRIARIENGDRRLTFAQAVILADVLGVSIEAFVPPIRSDEGT